MDPTSNSIETISIILPALNEEDAIGRQIHALLNHPAWSDLPLAEVIVVDNGSDDATARVAFAAGAHVIREPRRGYGAACYAGLLAATSEIVLLMDADGSDDLEGAARIACQVLSGHADLAMGSRIRGACEPGALTPQQRVGNWVALSLMRLLYGVRLTDLGPVRAIHRDALLKLDPRERTYGWSTEMLLKAARGLSHHRRAGGLSSPRRGRLQSVGDAPRLAARGLSDSGDGAAVRALAAPGAATHLQPTKGSGGRKRGASVTRTNPTRQHDALVIVAKYPAAGHVKTRLGATIGFEQSARLYHAFLCDLHERFSHASMTGGYDLIWACPDDPTSLTSIVGAEARILQQHGDDFAERLYQICRDCAALGYSRTVILGSDSPQAPANTMTRALALLASSDVVLGPAEDGGYYLIALRNQPTPPDLFTGITMSTPQVLAQTIERAATLGLSVELLESLSDVDVEEDLWQLGRALDASPSLAPRTHTLLQTLLTQAARPAHSGGDGHGAG